MQESEIKEALVAYVSSQGINLSDAEVDVSLTAGRGVNGNTATIDISKKNASATPPPVAIPRKVDAVPPQDTEVFGNDAPVEEADQEPADTTDIFAAK